MQEKILSALEPINAQLATHGGAVEFASLEDKTVKVYMRGACHGCPHAMATIKGYVEAVLREQVDPDLVVEALPQD